MTDRAIGSAGMARWQVWVLVLVTIAVAAVGAAAGWRWWDGRDTRDYPDSVRDGFLVSCSAAGAPDDRCSCMLEEIEERVTLTDFLALERTMAQTGEVPQRFAGPAEECGADLGAAAVATVESPEPTDGPGGEPTVQLPYPEGGPWVEGSGDSSCRWELADVDGTVLDQGAGDVVMVPSQIGALWVEQRCDWYPAGD